jgi:cardiolipin synthase (CMP-forming)
MAVATDGRKSQPRRAGERDVDTVLSRSPVNLANLVTIARLLMVAPLIWLIVTERLQAAFWLFLAAAASDALDGFIAKNFNARTNLGSYLDPLADKVLLIGIFLALAMGQWLPAWLVALVIGRDLLIVGGVMMIWRRHPVFRPRPLLIGKINTLVQILLAACTIADVGGWVDLALAVDGLIVVVALTTLWSGAGYAAQAIRGCIAEHAS